MMWTSRELVLARPWNALLTVAALSTVAIATATYGNSQERMPLPRSVTVGERQWSESAPRVAMSTIVDEPRIRAIVRASEMAAISSEINARIVYLPAREGDRFRKGDVIVRFDCGRIEAELDAAVAAYEAHKTAHANQLRLLSYRAAGQLTVDQARFEMQKHEAEVRGLRLKRNACTIHAPFDGRMVERSALIHEIAQPNQALIKIANESRLELVLMVPSQWLSTIGPGQAFLFTVDETGERHSARVIQSTGLIDAVSQSVRFIAEITPPSPTVLPGMSGTAEFAPMKFKP